MESTSLLSNFINDCENVSHYSLMIIFNNLTLKEPMNITADDTSIFVLIFIFRRKNKA